MSPFNGAGAFFLMNAEKPGELIGKVQKKLW